MDPFLPNAPRRHILLALTLTVLVFALLTLALLWPKPPRPPAPLPWDKAWHAVGFFALVMPLASVLQHTHFGSLFLAAALYGAVTEALQPHFGRSAEWGDLVANWLGAAMGIGAGAWLQRRF